MRVLTLHEQRTAWSVCDAVLEQRTAGAREAGHAVEGRGPRRDQVRLVLRTPDMISYPQEDMSPDILEGTSLQQRVPS